MHCYDKSVQGVKSRIRMRDTLEDTPYHFSGQLIFPPKTDSYGLVIVIYLILVVYPHPFAIVHVLQIVLK